MFGLVRNLSIRIRDFLRRYMPTNLLLAAVLKRRGLKWGMLASLVALPYLLAAVLCTGLIDGGAPGWANLLVMLFLWNGLKFIAVGPLSVFRLIQVRIREARARRGSRVLVMSDGVRLQRLEDARVPAKR